MNIKGLETFLDIQTAPLVLAKMGLSTLPPYRLIVWFDDMQEPLELLSWREVMEASENVCVWSLRLKHPGHYPYESSKCLWHHFSSQARANNMSDVLFSTQVGPTNTHTLINWAHKLVLCTLTKHLEHIVALRTHSHAPVPHAFVYRLTEKSMFFLSWFTARGSGTGSVCLSTETDSPVKIDWSTLSVVERMEVSLMSAGTLSPTEKKEKGLKCGLFYSGLDTYYNLEKYILIYYNIYLFCQAFE